MENTMNTHCPNCKTDCGPAGPYVKYVATEQDKAEQMTPGNTYIFPKDVTCAGCGATLRHTVPLFAVIPDHWRIIKPATKASTP